MVRCWWFIGAPLHLKCKSKLVAYGIPSETVRKLAPSIPENLEEEAVLQFIKSNRDRLVGPLMQYEKDRLDQCL